MAEALEDQESPESSKALGKRDLLYRLEVEQIAANWGLIRQAVLKSYPAHLPYSETILANIYQRLLRKQMECWTLTDVDLDKPEDSKVLVLGLVQITEDAVSGLRFMNIYSLYAFAPVSPKLWKSAWERFRKYARSIGVDRVLALTDNPAVVRLVDRLGGSTRQRSVQLEV